MKKRNLFFLLTVLVLSFTSVGCKKKGCTDPTADNYNSKAKKDDGSCFKAADYREQYVGQYNFTYYTAITIMGSPTTYDTTEYTGSVSLVNENSLHITFPSGNPYSEFIVSTSGVLTKCTTNVGSISTTGLTIEYDDDLCSPGPQGMNSLTTLVGIKQ